MEARSIERHETTKKHIDNLRVHEHGTTRFDVSTQDEAAVGRVRQPLGMIINTLRESMVAPDMSMSGVENNWRDEEPGWETGWDIDWSHIESGPSLNPDARQHMVRSLADNLEKFVAGELDIVEDLACEEPSCELFQKGLSAC
jgi:hypothetical protein